MSHSGVARRVFDNNLPTSTNGTSADEACYDSPPATQKLSLATPGSTPEKNRIRLTPGKGTSRLDERVVRKLDQLDKNKDGYFDKEDLVGVVEKLMQEERQSHVYKRAVCFAAGLMVFVLLANVGLAYAVAMLSKEVTVVGNALHSTTTGDEIEIASREMRIGHHGSLLPKHSMESDLDFELEGTPVQTTVATLSDGLDTRLSDEFLGTMERLRLSSPNGVTVSLNVHGFSRIPGSLLEEEGGQSEILEKAEAHHDMEDPPSPATDELNFLTSAGTITFGPNGTIHPDDQAAVFLANSGFDLQGDETNGRRKLMSYGSSAYASGDYRSKALQGCKYQPRYERDACKLYCAGFRSKGYSTEICHKEGYGNNNPYGPCKDGNKKRSDCGNTSSSCAPKNQFCCCYKGSKYPDRVERGSYQPPQQPYQPPKEVYQPPQQPYQPPQQPYQPPQQPYQPPQQPYQPPQNNYQSNYHFTWNK